jgi:hypothetical protein
LAKSVIGAGVAELTAGQAPASAKVIPHINIIAATIRRGRPVAAIRTLATSQLVVFEQRSPPEVPSVSPEGYRSALVERQQSAPDTGWETPVRALLPMLWEPNLAASEPCGADR